MRGELLAGMRQAAGNRGARSVQVRGRDCRLGGGARGAAHVEHFIHGRDEGRVPAERLIEGPRGFEHVAHGRDAGCVKAGQLVELVRVLEHLVHVGDAGCIEAEGLVEGLRHLPRIASMA